MVYTHATGVVSCSPILNVYENVNRQHVGLTCPFSSWVSNVAVAWSFSDLPVLGSECDQNVGLCVSVVCL